MKRGGLTRVAFLSYVLWTGCSHAVSTGYPQALSFIDASHSQAASDWVTYGHDYGEQRFSPERQIDRNSVSRLTPAYVFQTGVVGAFETSPVVADGVMYLTTAYDGVFAIDARTGELRWKREPLTETFRQCCGPVNRGVAVSKNLVFLGQLDGNVVALDRRTGRLRWSKRVADNKQGYSITMAPLVYRDLLIVGVGGGDLGIRGSLIALSLRDGKMRWRWFATDQQHWFGPSPVLKTDSGDLRGEAAARARSRYADSWLHGGGGIWTTPAIDPARNTIYLTTGNPWPDLDGSRRPGDNLFTDCVVALNASNGHMKWYFQEVPHDTMDLDAASPPILFQTIDAHGQRLDAVAEIGKTGVFYVFDRDSGKLARESQNLSGISMQRGDKQGWAGGASWSPMSFDPGLGFAIVTATRHLAPEPGQRRTSLRELEREWKVIFSSVSAVNVATGVVVWQDEFDGGLVGGTVSTAGGITFVGEGNGYFDALDTRTGERLWRFQTGAGVNAPPIVFAENGREYVAVAAGGNQQLGTPVGDSVFTFSYQQ